MTSRAEIVAAARNLIDSDGWDKLTVRRLATELGIGTTTLYHHVRDKPALLVLLLNEHLGTWPLPEPRTDDPRAQIIDTTIAMRDALAAWPWIADTVAVDGFIALLDESALTAVERIITSAIAGGCDEAQAVALFRNIWYLTTGEVLVRARSRQRRANDAADPDADFLSHLDPAASPRLAGIGARWVEYAARDTFVDGLRAMVDGMLPAAPQP